MNRDASKASIKEGVEAMELGVINTFITKLTFRFMLLKRAYTRREFEEFLSQAKFESVEILEDRIGLELLLQRL